MKYKNIFEELLSQIDIVNVIEKYLPLIKKGKNYLGMCPFHQDSNPSLNVSSEKQIYKCFACNNGGNAISFVEKYLKIPSLEALKIIAQDNAIDIKFNEVNNFKKQFLTKVQELLIDANEIVLSFFKYNLYDNKNKLLTNFIKNRKLDQNIIEYFNLGYANDEFLLEKILKRNSDLDEAILLNASLIKSNKTNFFQNRFIFPIHNENDFLVGFSGRNIDSNSTIKYLNTAENSLFNKGKILYNLNRAKEFINYNKEVIICEGFMDVIALHKINVKNVVAIMGTSFSNDHISIFKKIKNLKIILFLDNDKAGIKATLKLIEKIIDKNFDIEIVENDYQMDPDEILNQKGNKFLENILQKRINVFEFLLNYFLKQNNLNSTSKILNFFNEYSKYFKYANKNIKQILLAKINQIKELPKDLINKYFKINEFINSNFEKKSINYKNTLLEKNQLIDDTKTTKQNFLPFSGNFRLWDLNYQSEKVILSLLNSYNEDPEKKLIYIYSVKRKDFF